MVQFSGIVEDAAFRWRLSFLDKVFTNAGQRLVKIAHCLPGKSWSLKSDQRVYSPFDEKTSRKCIETTPSK
jgi:hypothetical protein